MLQSNCLTCLQFYLNRHYCFRTWLKGEAGHLLFDQTNNTNFSKRIIHILIVTWNMNGRKPKNNLKELDKFKNSLNLPDIVVIGTQESYTFRIVRWIQMIQSIIGESYVLKKKKQSGKLHLILFLHKKILSISSVINTKVIFLDGLSFFKSKGAISLTLRIDASQLIFTTVHLAPHQFNLKKRICQIKNLLNILKFTETLSEDCKHEGNGLILQQTILITE